MLILIQVARILLKRKGIDNLILALHLRADGSHQTWQTGMAYRPGAMAPWRGARWSSALELSGARLHWVSGAKRPRGRRGPYPGRNTVGNGSKMASDGGFPPLSMGDGERWLQCSFSFKKQLNTILVASSCF
jgi:hypothetical protein